MSARALARASLALACAGVTFAAAPPARGGSAPAADAELGAEEIYARALENRLDSSIQELTAVSTRGGLRMPIRVQLIWRRYAEGSDEAGQGIRSRLILRYLEPPELRRTGYLLVDRHEGPDDQFVYLKSLGRVRRVNLRRATLAGTDLSLHDLVPRELEEASFARQPDGFVGSAPCYVVEVLPHDPGASGYSRSLVYVEMQRFVPLRIRHWNEAGVEAKELRASAKAVRQLAGRWFPIRLLARDLLEETRTSLSVDLVAANPELPSRYFSQKQLVATHLEIPRRLLGEIRRY
jgi:hypothetical protein